MIDKIPLYKVGTDEDLGGVFRLFQMKSPNSTKTVLPNAPFPTNHPHRHNFFELLLFTEASGSHLLDFKNYAINSNSIHVVFPGQAHLIDLDYEKKCTGYIVAFNVEFLAIYFRQTPRFLNYSFFYDKDCPPILNLEEHHYLSLLDVISKITCEQKNEYTRDNIIRSYLNILLLKLDGLFTKIVPNKIPLASELFIKFRHLVERKFEHCHQVKDYADILQITPTKLNEICKVAGQKNASDFILDRILLAAKRNLMFSNMSNKEIAFRLGFNDPSYFSRFFRNKTGLSPSRFRRKMNEKYPKSVLL
ncbi:MAG: helix-turn-helix domain-containing protein [Pricia sp.]|nr:helix-turn-helix domain-containing protein [Pricia sp.]